MRCMLRYAHSPLNISKSIILFVYAAIQRQNYTYSFTATFTAHLEQHFMLMFMEFLLNVDELKALSAGPRRFVAFTFIWCT